jgi:phospholipid/cholesterol/gamma-HCH transport system substrate-binding protein
LQTSFGDFSAKAALTLDNINNTLSKENQKEFSKSLKYSASILQKVDKAIDEESIAHIRSTLSHLDSFSRKLDYMIPDIERLVNSSINWERNISNSLKVVADMYIGIDKSMKEMSEPFKNGEFDIKSMTQEFMPTLNATLMSLEKVLIEFDQTLREYRRSPSDLIFKEVEQKKAPGE